MLFYFFVSSSRKKLFKTKNKLLSRIVRKKKNSSMNLGIE